MAKLIGCLRESMDEENGPLAVSARLGLSVVYADLFVEPHRMASDLGIGRHNAR